MLEIISKNYYFFIFVVAVVINLIKNNDFSNEKNTLKDFILYSNKLINENKNNQTVLSLSS
jgi:hypothetical protein